MTDLNPITPLGGQVARVDVVGALTITENPECALASLAARKGREDDLTASIGAALGLELPAPGASAASAEHRAWWSGPGQWMIEADFATHELLANEIKQIVGDAGSVTEQTDGWCRFDVAGSDVLALFERLCAVDVQAMAEGAATRTSIHHTGCFLIRTAEGFNVIGPRSSAGSLHHALVEVAAGLA